MTTAFVGLGSNQCGGGGKDAAAHLAQKDAAARLAEKDAAAHLAEKDAAAHLAEAVTALEALPDMAVTALSPLYWTEPQDMADQPWFANRVARLACGKTWTALALMQSLLGIELALGRIRDTNPALRYGPRAIDLDLLLFGNEICTDPRCTLPHPRMTQRAFVLVPLRDIAPEVILTGGRSVAQALEALTYRVEGQKIYQS